MVNDFGAADRLMHEAVAQGVFPGAVLLVSRHGRIELHRAYGLSDTFSGRPMACDTVFDLASLTKPLATTLAVMLLFQQERLALDDPCAMHWPAFTGAGKEKITIRHLLSHCSGLPAWQPYYLRLSGRGGDVRSDMLRRAVIGEVLLADPGQRVEYSDLGFMALQWMVENMVGRTLDLFLEESVYHVLKLESLFFIGSLRQRPRRDYAATELCPLRGRLLIGEVHDDNASAAQGVAGHAGLFGTAGAVWELLQGLLAAAAGKKGHAVFEQETLQRFFEPRRGGGWALGFDTPAEQGSSAGKYFTPGSLGHLGFTGTSFWMDRIRDIIVILLTNRVHPSRYNARIKTFRPRLHDAVMEALGAGAGG